jgi:hypothetical protein
MVNAAKVMAGVAVEALRDPALIAWTPPTTRRAGTLANAPSNGVIWQEVDSRIIEGCYQALLRRTAARASSRASRARIVDEIERLHRDRIDGHTKRLAHHAHSGWGCARRRRTIWVPNTKAWTSNSLSARIAWSGVNMGAGARLPNGGPNGRFRQ